MPAANNFANHSNLCGTMTALVTPFNADGSLDTGALDALCDQQLDAQVSGLVPCGTTGEAATLTQAERGEVIARVAKKASGKAVVMAGAGTNSTAESLEHLRRAKDAGATHALVVTPYYNKPTPEGLCRHYRTLADADVLPIVVYNVPGRTGCDLKPDTLQHLAEHPNIAAIKEATGELARVQSIRAAAPHLRLLSGDDPTACAFVLMGGDGVISVASNAVPRMMTQMIHFGRDNNVTQARELHNQLIRLFTALFIESNPIPIKAAMAWQKFLGEHYRLPLCEMGSNNRNALFEVLRAMPRLD